MHNANSPGQAEHWGGSLKSRSLERTDRAPLRTFQCHDESGDKHRVNKQQSNFRFSYFIQQNVSVIILPLDAGTFGPRTLT